MLGGSQLWSACQTQGDPCSDSPGPEAPTFSVVPAVPPRGVTRGKEEHPDSSSSGRGADPASERDQCLPGTGVRVPHPAD